MAQKSILNNKPAILIKKYHQLLLKNKVPIEKIILFGSYAKGTAKPWSDLDLCVVSKKFGRKNFDEMVFLKKLAGQVEPMIEPHPYHPNDLKDRWDPLAAEIKKSGKVFRF